MQVGKLALEADFVVPPRYSVDPGGCVLGYRAERLFQALDRDVAPQRGEPLLLVAPCGLPYALPRRRRVGPALRPERALRDRLPRGPRPWLHRLRAGSLRFVRRLHGCYGGV